MVYTEANKKAIYKWRETHADVYKEYSRCYKKATYDDVAKQKKQDYYRAKKELKKNEISSLIALIRTQDNLEEPLGDPLEE